MAIARNDGGAVDVAGGDLEEHALFVGAAAVGVAVFGLEIEVGLWRERGAVGLQGDGFPNAQLAGDVDGIEEGGGLIAAAAQRKLRSAVEFAVVVLEGDGIIATGFQVIKLERTEHFLTAAIVGGF